MSNSETQVFPSAIPKKTQIFQHILKDLNLPWEKTAREQPIQSAKNQDTDEDQNLIDIELDFEVDDFHEAKNTNSATELLLAKFWPPKSAQYWIVSGEHKDGRELCEKLPLLLQDNPLIQPSSDVGLLFYYSTDPVAVYSLIFSNHSSSPLLKKCDNIEDELYKKEKNKKLLAVPSSKLQDGQLLIMTPPITQLGIIKQAKDLFWAFDVYSCKNERVVFFEDGLTPTTLRQSPILEDFEKTGRLHIIFCAWKMLEESGMKTDVNSPEEAAKIMFAKQAESLCPTCWRNIIFNSNFKAEQPGQKDFQLYDLLSRSDESGITLLRCMKLPCRAEPNYEKIKCNIKSLVVSELKLAYIDVLLLLLKIKQDTKIDDIGKSEELLINLTKTLFFYFSHQENCFPGSQKLSSIVKSCLAYVLFDFSCQIELILRETGMSRYAKGTSLYAKSTILQEKDLYKYYLFTDLPDFWKRSEPAILVLASKMEKLQKMFWKMEDKLK